MSKGLRKTGASLDNRIANGIHEATPAHTHSYPVRGSGNIKTPAGDVIITSPTYNHVIEAKRTSVDTGEHAYVLDQEDVDQLQACQNHNTRTWVAVKFTRRELLVCEFKTLSQLRERIPSPFDPHVTGGGRTRLTKPSCDVWPSQQSGDDDIEVLVAALGLEEEA